MKSSPLFGNGYYYPPQMAAHLPFMPHPAAMMNMAALGGHLPHGRLNGRVDDTPSNNKDSNNLASPIKDGGGGGGGGSIFDRHKFDELSHVTTAEASSTEKNNNSGASTMTTTPRTCTPRLPGSDVPLNLNMRDRERRASIDDSGVTSSRVAVF